MSYWKEKINIGGKEFPRFIGGPLDGITDSPFRKLVREFSKDALLYTEMRHVACVAHDKGVARSLNFDQSERPLNFQFTTNGTALIQEAVKKVLEVGVDAVDINIGCPAKNVVKSGSGSVLMSEEKLLEDVLKTFRSILPIPFTVKMRAGFKYKNAYDIAKMVQDCGADALTIHPRLQTEKFSGQLDYDLVYKIKKEIKIPIFFSGNIVDWQSAKMTYERTGVDGFMISRGLCGAPWKLQELQAHSLGQDYEIDNKVILSSALNHLDNLLEYFGDHGLYCFRKHLPYYIKGLEGASSVRKELIVSESVNEVKDGLAQFLGKK